MHYYIFTLGCQMNIYDSQKIEQYLDSNGCKSASEDEADLIIINACSVRQKAVDRIYGHLKKWQGKKIFITGCILPHDKKKLENKVEFFSDIQDLKKILNKIFPKSKTDSRLLKAESQSEAFVPIMTGCDNFCSYCAVPYTRGPEISRPEKDIIAEFKKLVTNGAKRIILLGQNVNNFKPSFVDLLRKIINIPGDFKIGFLTSNPWNFPEELVELVANEPKILKEIHLPLQSGDDEILRKMNRHYTAAQYLKLVNNLRFAISDLRLSTDIIVGFPGEIKKAFENTIKLCKKAKFNKAYIAMYSPRPGTSSPKKYRDNVPREEKKRRFQILDNLINPKTKP